MRLFPRQIGCLLDHFFLPLAGFKLFARCRLVLILANDLSRLHLLCSFSSTLAASVIEYPSMCKWVSLCKGEEVGGEEAGMLMDSLLSLVVAAVFYSSIIFIGKDHDYLT